MPLHVVLYASCEQFVARARSLQALSQIPVNRGLCPGSEVQNGIVSNGLLRDVLKFSPESRHCSSQLYCGFDDLVAHPQHEIPEHVVTRSADDRTMRRPRLAQGRSRLRRAPLSAQRSYLGVRRRQSFRQIEQAGGARSSATASGCDTPSSSSEPRCRLPRRRAKLSNSHGRIETSHSRMIVIGMVWPSTSIESLGASDMAAYLSVMSISVNAMMRSNLLTLLMATVESDLVVDPAADENGRVLVDVVALPGAVVGRVERTASILPAIFSWYSRSDGSRSTGNASRFARTAMPHPS